MTGESFPREPPQTHRAALPLTNSVARLLSNSADLPEIKEASRFRNLWQPINYLLVSLRVPLMSMKSVTRISRYTEHGNVVATVSLSYFFVFSSFETQGKECKNDSEEKTGVYVSGVKHARNRKEENTIKK